MDRQDTLRRSLAWTRPRISACSTSSTRSPTPAAATAVNIRCRPSWPGLLRHPVRRPGLCRHRPMGPRPGHRLMHRLGFTRRPPKLGGIRKVLIALAPDRPRGRPDRAGPSPCWAGPPRPRGAPRGVRLGRQDSSRQLRRPGEGRPSAVAGGPRVGADARPDRGPSAAARTRPTSTRPPCGCSEAWSSKGRLITGDAIFCQRDLCRQILEAGGHYLWFVKENQPTLLADIQAAFAPAPKGLFPPRQRRIWREAHGHGDDPGQGAWPSRASHADGDDGVECVSGLAGRRPGRPGRDGGGARRQVHDGDPLLHHQRPRALGGSRDAIAGGTGPLGDRDPPARRPTKRQLVRRRTGQLPSPWTPCWRWPRGATATLRTTEAPHAHQRIHLRPPRPRFRRRTH